MMPDDSGGGAGDLSTGQTVRGFVEGDRVFSRYILERILGRGGMGVVWLALDEELERKVDRKGCLGVSELRPIVAQLCGALDYAHLRAKVVHRDLKPANLMLTREGEHSGAAACASGAIFLQNVAPTIWYRNIRIRRL